MSESRPQPVLTSAALSAAFTAVVGLLVAFGLVPMAAKTDVLTAGNAVIGAVLAVVPAVATLVAALHARRKVTPTLAPMTDAGSELVPADHHAAVEDLIDQLHRLAGGVDSADATADGNTDSEVPDSVPVLAGVADIDASAAA